MGTNPPSLDQTGLAKKCSTLTSHGFVSPRVMVGFTFIVEGMSVTLRPVLWHGIDLEVEGPSWSEAVCHSIIGLVVIAGNLNAVRNREDILLPHVVTFLQAHPDMTLQQDNATSHTARSVRDFLQDRKSVFCHGQRRARISIPLSTSGTCWIGG